MRRISFVTIAFCVLTPLFVQGAGSLGPRALVSPAFAADANPIVAENQKPGTGAWVIGRSPYMKADDANGQIKGYASATSVNKGESIDLKVSANPAQKYSVDFYRLGCYPDANGVCKGGRLVDSVGPLDGVTQPACQVDGPSGTNTGLTECNWSGWTFNVPSTWVSGIYLAVLTNESLYQNYIQFVVRDDGRRAALLYEQPVGTYQAYNNYPNYGEGDLRSGKSLYDSKSGGEDTVAGTGRRRAVKVSFDRPYANSGADDLLDTNGWSWETYFIRWIEKMGYDVSYATNVDLHANGAMLRNHRGILSVGHDEYWSKEMFDAAEAARDAGVNLAFFGANDVYWQVRFEPSTTGVPNRVMVSYKNTPNNTYLTNDPIADPSLKTVRFEDPPVNRPSQSLLGVTFSAGNGRSNRNSPLVVTNSGHWSYAGTGFTDGSRTTNLAGYEVDKYSCQHPLPAHTTYTVLSRSPFVDAEGYTEHGNSTIYRAPSGAWVFAAGTMSWSWGLDREGFIDPGVQKTTVNLLDAFVGATTAPDGESSIPECSDRKVMTFEDGTLTGSNGADKALGTIVLDSAAPIEGSYSAKVPGASNSYLNERITAVDELTVTLSLKLNALPAADARIVNTTAVHATTGNLVVRPDGALCVRFGNAWIGGTSGTACTKTPLVPGTTYRVVLHEIVGTGTDAILEAYVAAAGAPLGEPFARTTTGTWTVRPDRVSVGTTTSVALDALFDEIRIEGGPVSAPAAPTALAAVASTIANEVFLTWNDAATNESSYVVERSTSSSFDGATSLTVPANAARYTDTGVSTDTTYYYRAKAINAAGSSAFSNVVSVTTRPTPPAAPTALTATFVSPTETRLDWTDNANNETNIVLERSGDSRFATVTTFTLPANTTSYSDAGLRQGTYVYRVRATNAVVASSPSNVVRGPRLKDITFEDGTSNLVHAITGVEKNANGTVVQDATTPINGRYSARVPNTNAYVEQTFAALDEVFVSFYVRLAARPAADLRIAQVLNAGVNVANLWIRASGALCLKYGNYWSGGSSGTACTATSAALQVAPTVYRVGVRQKRGDGTSTAVVEAFVAQGDAAFGVPFASSTLAPSAAGYWQTQATTLRVGGTLGTGNNLDATFDDIKLDAAFMPGPSGS